MARHGIACEVLHAALLVKVEGASAWSACVNRHRVGRAEQKRKGWRAMPNIEVILILLFAVALLAILARRLTQPYPILLVLTR